MAPLMVQLVATAIARWFMPWKDAARIGLAVMLLFTAGSHFSNLKYDLAAMIPPPLTGALWVIYVTGILEFAGALGLVTRSLRRPAAWGLIALLVGLFPANVYAAISGVTLGGKPPTALLMRAPLQLFWIGLLWWFATGQRTNQTDAPRGDVPRAAAILLIVIVLAGCSTPASTPVTVAAAPTNTTNDDLGLRPDARSKSSHAAGDARDTAE
jgi:uncharacterized membrane protein